jgi:hypothetical protein
LSCPALAAAQEQDVTRSGSYVGVAGTWAIELFDPPPPLDVDNSIGLNARAGYRFMPYLAAELHYEWGSEFDVDAGVFGETEIETHVATVNVKGIYTSPNVGPIQPYLLAGAGFMYAEADDIDVDETGFAARMGGGFDLYFSESVSAVAEVTYVLTTGDVDGLDYLSLAWGLRYHF